MCFNVHRKRLCVWGGWGGGGLSILFLRKREMALYESVSLLLLAWCVAIALCKALYALTTSSSSSFSCPPSGGRETLTDYIAARKGLTGDRGWGERHYSILQLKTTTKDD